MNHERPYGDDDDDQEEQEVELDPFWDDTPTPPKEKPAPLGWRKRSADEEVRNQKKDYDRDRVAEELERRKKNQALASDAITSLAVSEEKAVRTEATPKLLELVDIDQEVPNWQNPKRWERQPQSFRQPGETWAAWGHRLDLENEHQRRVDAALGFPRVYALLELLDSAVPLGRKKSAVASYHAWALDICDPRDNFSGWEFTSLPSYSFLKRHRVWQKYENETAAAKESRRPVRDRAHEHKQRRAFAWLEKRKAALHLESIEFAPTESKLMTEARKRLEVLAVTLEQFLGRQ